MLTPCLVCTRRRSLSCGRYCTVISRHTAHGKPSQLYDVDDDPAEAHNLWQERPVPPLDEVQELLVGMATRFEEELHAEWRTAGFE